MAATCFQKTPMRLTEFTLQNTPKWLPFQEPSRLYTNEHDVAVHGYGRNPFRGMSACLYDRMQRRWYQLNTDTEPDNEDPESWLENTLLQHINEQIPFNVITIKNGKTKFSLLPNIGRPVRPPVVSSSTLPTADYGDVISKRYYDISVDTSLWNGEKYMYKQIEFDEDVPRLQREVWCREKLRHFLQRDSSSSWHGACPISALVVDGKSPGLCGLLMPDAGTPLVRLPNGKLRLSHLVSLLETLKLFMETFVNGTFVSMHCQST